MPIVVTCGCGAILRARDALAGHKAKCPSCGAVMRIPAKQFDPEEDIADLLGPAVGASQADMPQSAPEIPPPAAAFAPPAPVVPQYAASRAASAAMIAQPAAAATAGGFGIGRYLY